MSKLKEEFLEFFIEEVQDIIDRLEQTMLNFEQASTDEEINRSIKRDFHTLKGDFLTYNFKQYSDYFHKVEDLWAIEELRPFTSETILKNIYEIRDFLKITQNDGLIEAKKFEEKSLMFSDLTKDNSEKNKSSPTKDNFSKEFTPSDGYEVFFTDNINNTSDNNYTFTLFFKDENSLKLEEIEQFFNLHSEVLYIKKIDSYTFKSIISTDNLNDLILNLSNIIGEENFSYEKGGELSAPIESNIISSNLSEIKEIKTIKVNTDNLNFLLNNIGELITKHSSLTIFKNDLSDKNKNYFEELIYTIDKITKDIQEEIFNMRLIPARFLFSQLRRIIRDISKELGKNVSFEISGEDIQLDKEILDKLSAPLKHMLKNSLDHGIESPEERKKLGKNPQGILRLELYQKSEDVIIEIFDDGRGLNNKIILKRALEIGLAEKNKAYTDEEIQNFIFSPDFSTSESVSEISGRGMGMDVVKNNINELNGTIEISSEKGVFTSFKLTLPTTLSVIDGFLIKQKEKNYVIPLYSIFEVLNSKSKEISMTNTSLEYNGIVYNLVLNLSSCSPAVFILVQTGQKYFALPVDEIVGRRQFIVKKLNIKSEKLEKYLGATILSTGETALVINPKKL